MNHPSRFRLALAIGLGLLAAERTAYADGELEGQIRGRIVEAATDAPVPGATVTVSAPNLGDPHIVTTNEDGEFLVPGLPIGHYTVTVSYEGVQPVSRHVLVEPGVTSTVNIRWSAELTEPETTTVLEERPVTNPGSSQTGSVLSADLERHIPGSHSNFFDLAQSVPGVRSGGQGPNYEPFINGGRERDSRYYVDGLEVTDMVSRFSNQRIALEGLQSVQVITGGFDAEYNSFGGVVNAITREGSDEWHGRASSYLEHSALQKQPPVGLLLAEGNEPFDSRPRDPSYTSFNAASLGGPIIKHRLWFNATFEYRYTANGRRAAPPLNLPPPSQTEKRYLGILKLTAAPSAKQRVTVSLIMDPLYQDNTAGTNTRLNMYQRRDEEGGYNGVIRWSYFPTPSLELQIDAGIKTWHRYQGPSGYFGVHDTSYCDLFSERNCHYEREQPAHHNHVDESIWYNNDGDYTRDNRQSTQISPKLTWRGRFLGEHSAKIGAQIKILARKRNIHTPGYYRYDDRNGGPLEDGVCDPDAEKTAGCSSRTFHGDKIYNDLGHVTAFFFQDHWKMRRLTLAPGVRVDYGTTRTADRQVFSSKLAFGPRIGVIVDLTGDQKTIFSTNYGRSNEVANFEQLANYDDNLASITRTDDWNRDRQEWVTRISGGGTTGNVYYGRGNVEHTDQITSSLRREIFRNTALSLEHIWKRHSDRWQTNFEINKIWDPTGFRTIDFRDGLNHSVERFATYDNSRNYNGFNIAVQSRPTPNWYFNAYYTISWLWGGDVSSVPQQQKFQHGFLAEDYRHRINVAVSYLSGFGLILGGRFDYNSGNPVTKHFYRTDGGTQDRDRSPQGTDPGTCSGNIPGVGNYSPTTTSCGNNTDYISELRNPPRTRIDLQLEYDFYQLLRQHIALSFEILDILNERRSNITSTDGNSGTFGYRSDTNPGGTRFRVGARWDF